jgi:hypothetical protein
MKIGAIHRKMRVQTEMRVEYLAPNARKKVAGEKRERAAPGFQASFRAPALSDSFIMDASIGFAWIYQEHSPPETDRLLNAPF